jgi:hypothetical protein
MMKHRINDCAINLPSLTDCQLNKIIEANREQLRHVENECEFLTVERRRRALDDKTPSPVLGAFH